MNRDTALDTYRYLRGGIPVMLVMLGVALLIEHAHASCWQTSISAYYFTSAHGVFIAPLCAIGTLITVYKGSKDFGAYWVVQTIEPWNASTRDELTADACHGQGARLVRAL